MLYKLIYMFHGECSGLNVFKYITFRTILATLTALILFLLLGRRVIELLKQMQVGQYIQEDGPPNHKSKQGTPTMGGILIIFVVLFSTFLWANPANPYVLLCMSVLVLFGIIGFIDDYLKIKRKNNKGLTAKVKFLWQCFFSLVISYLIFHVKGFDHHLYVPLFKSIHPDLGMFYILFMAFVIVASSNAVNLTDGLDGLAISPLIVAFGCYLIFSYVAGHKIIASYLHIPYIAGAGEVSVFCGAIIGAGLGFLWYNAYPAEVFMGDVGSLSLGAAIGTVAVITKQEIIFVIIGGIFVIEAISVIFQVAYYKITGGKRIFKMAPIHHHFELKGWPEPKVIVRFWIISIILALLGLSTLKLR